MLSPGITIVGNKLCLPDDAQIESNEWSYKTYMVATRNFISVLPDIIARVIAEYGSVDAIKAFDEHRDELTRITVIRSHDWSSPTFDLDITVGSDLKIIQPICNRVIERIKRYFSYTLMSTRRVLIPLSCRISFGDVYAIGLVQSTLQKHDHV